MKNLILSGRADFTPLSKGSIRFVRCLFLGMAAMSFAKTNLDNVQIASKVLPSVVLLKGTGDSGGSLGSGFILSSDGKIATNLHVIREWKSGGVQLQNGDTFSVLSVLAFDATKDLAIVQIAGFDLSPCELGNSNDLKVGESVIAVGSPRGLQGTVTVGVISAVRDDLVGTGFKVIQTDAAANPGNSGGPLVNSRGQIIGVISSKLKASEGLNFAVPINYVRGLMNALQPPMTLDIMRARLNSAVDVFKATAAENPVRWKSMTSNKVFELRWVGERIYAELLKVQAEQTSGFQTMEVQKNGTVYTGVSRYGGVCRWYRGFGNWETNNCRFEKQAEFTQVSKDRIEGRTMGPPPSSKLDCKKCTYSKPDEWRPFIWIPQ